MSAVVNGGGPIVARGKNRWQRRELSGVAQEPTVQAAIVVSTGGLATRVARSGQKVDAERWRSAFLGALRLQSAPQVLHAELISGVNIEAWRMLLDENKLPFKTFRQFCLAPQPFGLETPPEQVEAFLRSLLGERRTDLLLVPQPQQGVRTDLSPTSSPGGTKCKTHEKRLRAVNRAPTEIRRLCELSVLTYQEAEPFGAKKPKPERRVAIEEFAVQAGRVVLALGESPSEAEIARARDEVRGLLPGSSPAEKLMKQVDRLSQADRAEFTRLFMTRLTGAPASAGVNGERPGQGSNIAAEDHLCAGQHGMAS